MRIDRLTVKNFKGFAERTFEFGPEFNLLVGENGSGKTSALQAIALALAQALLALGRGFLTTLAPNQIRHERQGSNGAVRFEPCFPFTLEWTGTIQGQRFTCRADAAAENQIDNWFSRSGSEVSALISALQRMQAVPDSTLPLFAYYPANRSTAEAAHPHIQWQPVMTAKPQRMDGYAACLTGAAQAQAFLSWLGREQIISLQAGTPTKLFTVVERAVCGCLPGATAISFVVREGDAVIRMENSRDLLFADLSDGQRSLLAMAADMAIRAAQLNGHLGDDLLAETPGVVLIDELDLHLHPRWQRRVVADLRRVFPKVQFIATTHSPQIIGETPPEQILVLTATGTRRVPQSFGLDSNAVLEEVMDAPARNEGVGRGLDEIYRRIEADDLEGAKDKIAELRALQHGPTAPLAGAQALVDRIEMLSDEMTPAVAE